MLDAEDELFCSLTDSQPTRFSKALQGEPLNDNLRIEIERDLAEVRLQGAAESGETMPTGQMICSLFLFLASVAMLTNARDCAAGDHHEESQRASKWRTRWSTEFKAAGTFLPKMGEIKPMLRIKIREKLE